MRDKNGNPLVPDGTAKFYSYLRTCRAMWDLEFPQDRRAALTFETRFNASPLMTCSPIYIFDHGATEQSLELTAR